MNNCLFVFQDQNEYSIPLSFLQFHKSSILYEWFIDPDINENNNIYVDHPFDDFDLFISLCNGSKYNKNLFSYNEIVHMKENESFYNINLSLFWNQCSPFTKSKELFKIVDENGGIIYNNEYERIKDDESFYFSKNVNLLFRDLSLEVSMLQIVVDLFTETEQYNITGFIIQDCNLETSECYIYIYKMISLFSKYLMKLTIQNSLHIEDQKRTFIHLLSSLYFPQLLSIDLSMNQLYNEKSLTILKLCQSVSCPQLQKINLNENDIHQDIFTVFLNDYINNKYPQLYVFRVERNFLNINQAFKHSRLILYTNTLLQDID
ncbi:hypothetical protein WA158_000424 [Blastocystis sp. Blastoise]